MVPRTDEKIHRLGALLGRGALLISILLGRSYPLKTLSWSAVAMAAVLATGCGSSATVTQLAPGDSHCPNGGIDVKQNNVDEYLCNNPGELTKVVQLPVGDSHCPGGGRSWTGIS